MSFQRSGVNNSSAYQVSGWPFVTSSYLTTSVGYVKVTFPSVVKSFTVINNDANDLWPNNMTGSTPINVFFGTDLTGSYPGLAVTNRHAVPIPVSGSMTFDNKCTQVFIGKKHPTAFGAFTIVAELTSVEYTELYSGTYRDGIFSSSVGIDLP